MARFSRMIGPEPQPGALRPVQAHLRAWALALGAVASIAFAAPSAYALSLDQVVPGSVSVVGPLSITWDKIETIGAVDLSRIDLSWLSDGGSYGFRLDADPAAMALLGPSQNADLKLEFSVVSSLAILSVSNTLSATVSGATASVSVSELLAEVPAADPSVFIGSSFGLPTNSAALPSSTSLTVTKNIVASAIGAGDSARFDRLEQTFAVVPEPGTAVLVLFGLCGLGLRRRSVRKGLPVMCAALAGGLLLAPTASEALTLADLDAGASVTTSDGRLTFDDFSVSLPGGAGNVLSGIDLSFLTVDVFSDSLGFSVLELDAPIVAPAGQLGRLVIEYNVFASEGYAIDQVDLSVTAAAFGSGATATVNEQIRAATGDFMLTVSRRGDGLGVPVASIDLGPGVSELSITRTLTVDARDGWLAQMSEVEGRFGTTAAPVPEPGAALLFGLGSFLLSARFRGRGIPSRR